MLNWFIKRLNITKNKQKLHFCKEMGKNKGTAASEKYFEVAFQKD